MTVTPETGRWDALAAARTRGDVGEGIASVLALLGMPDLISFAGGFPDPETFPRERVSALLAGVRRRRRGERLPVRADARAGRRRATRSPTGSSGCRAAAPPTTSC